MPEISAAISCNLDANILLAAVPLFESEKIEALEWSFDTLFKTAVFPDWFNELLHTFANENRLIGHGVFFSIFSAKWLPQQQLWLKHLERLSTEFKFDHISEHFGFMTGENFHSGAPLSVPFTSQTLAIGQDRLKRIYNACKCPVGIENLAFSYSLDEVKKHGDFLEQLVAPVNGFIILDIHNLYCQTKNFNISFPDILDLYPLQLVREMHISGGSWEDSKIVTGKKVRRDTHDDAVPDEVFEMLEHAIKKCPNLKYVVLEQLGTGLATTKSRQQFQQDFIQLHHILHKEDNSVATKAAQDFLPSAVFDEGKPIEDEKFYTQQMVLSHILETALDCKHAIKLLQESNLSHTDWDIENWQPYMLETAIAIAQKWKNGLPKP